MTTPDPAIEQLGIELTEVSDERVVATMTAKADMANSHGVCHGGVLFLLADTTMDYLTNSAPGTHFAAHAEIDYLRPAFAGDELTATATVRERWGRATLVDCVVTKAGSDDAIAHFRGRTRAAAERKPT